MNLPNDTFCILPWVSLETSPIGTMRPCCMADIELENENGVKFEAETATLDTVRNCDQMYDLRDQFLQGERPNVCRRCWAEEDAGRTSKRQNTIKRMDKMISPVTEWTRYANELMFLDLKLGNICNLKCRICGPWSSSSIASEELMLLPKDERKGTYSDTMLKKGAWPRKSRTFWQELYDHSNKLTYLEFTGGEPFMIKEHFDYLKFLVDAGLSKNIEIHYNTNGTQWPDKYFYLWPSFKHVEVAFSIDNIGERFEYERDGAKWKETEAIVAGFIEMRDSSFTNMSLQLCTTVNIFNAYYLEDIVNWDLFDKFDFVFWNMLHDAPEWCITALPRNAKKEIANKLSNAFTFSSDPKHLPVQQEFDNIVKFMMGHSSITSYELMIKVKNLDLKRGQHMSVTHPDLWRLIAGAAFAKT